MISMVCQRLEGRSPTLMIHGGYKTRLFVKSDGYKQWKYGSNEDVFREDESLTLPDRAQWWWCGGGGDFLFSRPSVAGYGGRRAPVRMRVSALLLPAGWAYTLTLSNYLSHISPPHHRSQPQQHQQKIVSFHQNFPQEKNQQHQEYS